MGGWLEGIPLLWGFRGGVAKGPFTSPFPGAAKRFWCKTSGKGILHWHCPICPRGGPSCGVCDTPGLSPTVGSGGSSEPPGHCEKGTLLPSWPPAPTLSFVLPQNLPSAQCWPGKGQKPRLSLRGDHTTQHKASPAQGIVQGMADPMLDGLEATQDGQDGCFPLRDRTLRGHSSLCQAPRLCPDALPSLAEGRLLAGTGCATQGWQLSRAAPRLGDG